MTTSPSFTVDSVDITQLTNTLFTNTDGIPQFINAMEAAHRKSKRVKLEILDEYMHAVALKLLLKPGEYEIETRKWLKLPGYQQTWTAWKTMFMEAYAVKRWAKYAREGEDKPFGGAAADKAQYQLHWQVSTYSVVSAPLSN